MNCGFKLQEMIYASYKGNKEDREEYLNYITSFCMHCPYYYDGQACMYGEQFVNNDGLIDENEEM